MNIEKPDVLKLKEIPERIFKYGTQRIAQKMCYTAGWKDGAEDQRDADTSYFEPLIEQAKEEVAREIEAFMQLHLYARPDVPTATMKFTDWKRLRKLLSKYTEGEKDTRFNVTSYSVNVGTIKSEGK